MTGHDDLTALLDRCVDGDLEALAALYDVTSSQVLGLALQVLQDPAMAEEVALATFVEIWSLAGARDPGDGSVRGWIFTLAHAHAVERLRRHDLRGRASVDLDRATEHAPATAEGRRVAAALGRLSDAQRLAIGLTYFDGHTIAEAARQIGIPVGSATTRLRDALLRLRIELVDARFA